MHAAPKAIFLDSGDTALVIEFGDGMDRGLSARILDPISHREYEAILARVASREYELRPTGG